MPGRTESSRVDAVAILEVASSPCVRRGARGTVTLTDAVDNGSGRAGDVVGVLSGSVRAMLQLERTVLNMLSMPLVWRRIPRSGWRRCGPDVAVRIPQDLPACGCCRSARWCTAVGRRTATTRPGDGEDVHVFAGGGW